MGLSNSIKMLCTGIKIFVNFKKNKKAKNKVSSGGWNKFDKVLENVM
jgi:hypothetical protein